MSEQIVPGPCGPGPCPAPTEIDCIQVNKVYDFCFEADTSTPTTPLTLPAKCGTVPSTATITGTVSSVTCTVASSIAILDAAGNPTGFADVTLVVNATVTYTITSAAGATICTFDDDTFTFVKTIVLCAPSGTTVDCTIPSSSVVPSIVNGQVFRTITICLLVSSVALVNLLVPSYGFCTPAPCVVAPAPPFACPPSPLFPAACTSAPPTTAW